MAQDELRPSSPSDDSLQYHQLDDMDQRIVDHLRVDGRMPYREIARQLDVSEGMVRKRVTRLLDSGWMRILAVSNPLQLGVPILATTYAYVVPQHVEQITDALAELEPVRYVAIGISQPNVVLESIHESHTDVHDFIQRELTREGVMSSETILVVKIKKSIWDWKIPPHSKE